MCCLVPAPERPAPATFTFTTHLAVVYARSDPPFTWERMGATEPHADGSIDRPAVPDGLVVLRRPHPRSAALHRLVADELRRQDGPAYWVDGSNDASTQELYRHASRRTLAGLWVTRAFTAYQHYEAVRDLPRVARPGTTLLVAPGVAAQYADDDVPDWEARDMLDAGIAVLRETARALDCPVLATVDEAGPLADRVRDAADHELAVEHTDFGFRYSGDDFETTAYAGVGHWQTTIPYWVDLFGATDAFDPWESTVFDAQSSLDAPLGVA